MASPVPCCDQFLGVDIAEAVCPGDEIEIVSDAFPRNRLDLTTGVFELPGQFIELIGCRVRQDVERILVFGLLPFNLFAKREKNLLLRAGSSPVYHDCSTNRQLTSPRCGSR